MAQYLWSARQVRPGSRQAVRQAAEPQGSARRLAAMPSALWTCVIIRWLILVSFWHARRPAWLRDSTCKAPEAPIAACRCSIALPDRVSNTKAAPSALAAAPQPNLPGWRTWAAR